MEKIRLNLQLFADASTNVNVTTQAGIITPQMKTFYNTALLRNAEIEYFFPQFGKKQVLPANHGRMVEWRKKNELPNASVLTEGVIPTGENLGFTFLTSPIVQRGMYVTMSDLLTLHAIDPILTETVESLGQSYGNTEDIAVRNELMTGSNVMYADTLDSNGAYASTPLGRYQMSAANNKLTPMMVAKAATHLKKMKAPMINGKYVAIIHPSVTHDLRVNNPEWIEYHKYANTTEIFNGEVGELHGVRFVESHNAKVWSGKKLTASNRYLTCTVTYIENDAGSTPSAGEATAYKLTIAETPTADLVGRLVHVYDKSATGYVGTVEITGIDAASKYVWLDSPLGITPAADDLLFPGEGAAEGVADTVGSAVYACLFLGNEAYGMIDPAGGSMEMIIKNKSEIGGPLDQFSTAGYKFEGGTKILYEERILRVECCSSYSKIDETN